MSSRYRVIILFCFIAFFTIQNIYSQTFGVSPNKDGQLNPQVDFSWLYNSSSKGGQLRIKTIAESDIDNESPGSGLSKSITTVENHLFLELVPIFYSFKANGLTWKPGIAIKADRYDIQEVGFQDVIQSSVQYRLFFNNDRTISAIRPGIFSGFDYKQGNFSTQLNGFYSPWFYIQMDQEFSSAAEGTTVLDTPVTSYNFLGNGLNAWGVFSSIKLETKIISLDLQTAWEGFTLTYDYVGIGGTVYSSQISNITGSLDFLAGISVLNLKGFNPVIGVGLSLDITQDLANNGEWEIQNNPNQLIIGFRKILE